MCMGEMIGVEERKRGGIAKEKRRAFYILTLIF